MQSRQAGNGKVSSKKAAVGASVNRDKASGLNAFWLRGVAGVALILMLASLAGASLWEISHDARSVLGHERCSRVLVRELGNQVTSLQGHLRDSGLDPQIQDALRKARASDLRAGEDLLRGRIPNAVKISLLPGGETLTDDPGAQPLSYAGLDMVRLAETQGRITPLEVHRLGHQNAHLAVAGPVFDEPSGGVLGVVHVALPLSLLPSAKDAGGDVALVLFQQQVGNDVVVVDPEKSGGVPQRAPDLVMDVPGTSLRVISWATRSRLMDAPLLLFVGAAFLLVLALIGAVLWLPLRSLRRALVADYAGLVAMVEDVVNRRPMGRPSCRLAETRPVAADLGRLLGHLQPVQRPVSSAPTPGSERPDAERAPADPHRPVMKRKAKPEGIVVDELAGQIEGAGVGRRPQGEVPAEIFRAYDIRGIVGRDLTVELARDIGLAVGTETGKTSDLTVFVARDTRATGKDLSEALVRGLRGTGCNVVDLGVAPTPVLYFATRYRGEASGVMVTASHNPLSYNGFKVVIGGNTLQPEQIQGLRECILGSAFAKGDGGFRKENLIPEYIDRVRDEVALATTPRVAIDCGNAAASVVAPDLFRALGCEVVEINCDPQQAPPGGRVPDPTRPECLEALQGCVTRVGADVGLAFDGDGDRLGVVDSSGKPIWADRLLMLLAADLLSRHPGADVVFDVKSSHHLAAEVRRRGGRPLMWKSGHSNLKAKVRETGALLAGEWTGHIIFQDRWYGFDDALYAGARLLEVLASDPRPSAEVFSELPEALGTPELFLHLEEGQAPGIINSLQGFAARLEGAEVRTLDGLRVDLDDSWGLVRASNTQPALVFRFEADDKASLNRIEELFRRMMKRAAPGLELPF
ncbi:MAG: phosphomannomutase/phosphoglucomutase [Pseudomonadota bacterium]|nr:phosphomannomutase/phosphoglucomutase [Pseudomonadota bacterium]